MPLPAIRVEKLSKRYTIGPTRQRDDTLRDLLATQLRRWTTSRRPDPTRVLWALNDVSFEVAPGEVIGIIGGNGAGKSTLLKILSRITWPTSGRVEVRGRVGSLLEVGTGFHPELTGRENIYLNSAILGMSRSEIRRKFDEIVAFSEIEPFLDTPVKHYSSGMNVRLGFAVAAHLSPRILIVDEVLAVGDVNFQKKCLGKIGEASRGGRTILFVSHNLSIVRALCTRGIFLERGMVRWDGDVSSAINAYLRTMETASVEDLSRRTDRRGEGKIRLLGVTVTRGDDPSLTTLVTGLPARFTFSINYLIQGMSCSFTIYNREGASILCFDSSIAGTEDRHDYGEGCLVCIIDELSLLPGTYRVNAALYTGGDLQDHLEGVATFEVAQGLMRGRPEAENEVQSCVCVAHRWALPTSLALK
jgi:lipopolysaccharide transport system ATP-binding protein